MSKEDFELFERLGFFKREIEVKPSFFNEKKTPKIQKFFLRSKNHVLNLVSIFLVLRIFAGRFTSNSFQGLE